MAPSSTRVLVLTNMYPPHHYGGYELSCRDVVDRWRAADLDVEVLTTSMRVPGTADPVEPHVRRELEWYWDAHDLTSPPPWRRLWLERANQRRLARALREVEPDVVSVWNMGGMSLGLLTTLAATGIPLVFVVCDDWLIYGPRLDAWTRAFSTRARLGKLVGTVAAVPTSLPDVGASGAHCFVSQTTRQRAIEHSGWRFPLSTVVYSGIDPADFPLGGRAPLARPWGGNLLYVGRIDRRKGIATAIEALALLDEAHTLDIVGSGDDQHLDELRALVDRCGLGSRVRFSSVERSRLAGRYRVADALLFPSEWTEPFGLVPVEAMACGTPVIATGVGGSGEFLVDGANCVLFPPGDREGLAAAVRRLAGEPSLRARLVAGGAVTAAELTVDRLAEVLSGWHLAAADRFTGGPPEDRPPPAPPAGPAMATTYSPRP